MRHQPDRSGRRPPTRRSRAARRPWRAAAAALVLGAAGSGGVAAAVAMPGRDLAVLLALTMLGVLVVVGAGLAGEAWLRRRGAGMARHSALTAGVTAAATLAGLGAVAVAMLLNQHDLAVVLATLPVAAGTGVSYAILSANRTAADLETLAAVAARLADGPGAGSGLSGLKGTAEVVEVAEALSAAAVRLAAAREREREMEASRRDLVAWASHDLRTPLTSLRAVAEALTDGVVTDEAGRRRYLASLTAHVDRLTRLVDDLFELSQIEAGALALQFEPTYLPDLILEVLDRFGPGADAVGVRIEADVPSRFQLVPAGRDQVGRVLANLVANGLRHTPPGGRVLIRASDEPAGAVVRVADQCGGILEADLAHVFDRMWRGDPARSADGAGLGLAIARGLVEAHGGRIQVANVRGGCQFTFSLPREVQPGLRRTAASGYQQAR